MSAKLADGETKSTPINMFNHSYFNLAGHDSPEGIRNHSLQIFADKTTPVDEAWIPTREVKNLDDVPELDFRQPKLLKDAFKGLEKCKDP